jgi:hypothetical protein
MFGLEADANRNLLYVLNLLVVIFFIYYSALLRNDKHVYVDITPRVNQLGKSMLLTDEHAYGGMLQMDPTTYGWQRIQPLLQSDGIRYIDNSPTGDNTVPTGDVGKYWIPWYISTYDNNAANWNTLTSQAITYGSYAAVIASLLVLATDVEAYNNLGKPQSTLILPHPSPLIIRHP